MKRREFLVSGAGAAALSIAPATGAIAAASGGGAAPTAAPGLDLAAFEALVGERFALRDGAPGASLVLAEIRRPGSEDGARLEQFSLVFETVDGQPLETRTHVLSHPALGLLPLYLESSAAGSTHTARADFSLLA